MIVVIISWTILFLVCLSFGNITKEIFIRLEKQDKSYSLVDRLFLGIASIAVILLYISILFPLNAWVLLGIAGISSIYWARRIKQTKLIWGKTRQYIRSIKTEYKLLFFLCFVIVLIYSICTPLIYDEGLYHLQAMQWSAKFRTVIGIGNLHGRLGFNSSFLLLSTVFNYHPDYFNSFFSINSFALLIFSFWIIQQANINSHNKIRAITLYAVLAICLFSLGTNISSTSTDILPSILLMYLLLKASLQPNFIKDYALLIAAIAIITITMKLSMAILGFSLVAYIVYLLFGKKDKKAAIGVGTIGLLISIPWLIRFVLMTGYLIYPFSTIDLFSFDWKIPSNIVKLEQELAYSWARIPHVETSKVIAMSFVEWFPIWLKNLSFYNSALYASALLSPIALFFSTKTKEDFILWLVAASGLFFSLATAPDFRFAFSFILAAISVPLLNLKIDLRKSVSYIAYPSILLICFFIGYTAIQQVKTYQGRASNKWMELVLRPQAIGLAHSNIEISYQELTIGHHLLYVPEDTNQCFDHAIPCTPYFNANLEMRGKDIEDGFRVKTYN